MGNEDIREIVRLKEQLKMALLRAKNLSFTYKVPARFGVNRTRTAYDSGYESGWRGWKYDNPYSTAHHQSAYCHGYSDAITQLHKEALL